jgi:putative FmdB family regulatory protein
MPTYEYRCRNGHDFEEFVLNMSAGKSQLACPTCGERGERRLSAGAGLLFKGSGFYITDYGKDGKKQQATANRGADKGEGAASDGAKADASKADAPKTGQSKSDSSKSASPKSESSKTDSSRAEASRAESSRAESPKSERSKGDASARDERKSSDAKSPSTPAAPPAKGSE